MILSKEVEDFRTLLSSIPLQKGGHLEVLLVDDARIKNFIPHIYKNTPFRPTIPNFLQVGTETRQDTHCHVLARWNMHFWQEVPPESLVDLVGPMCGRLTSFTPAQIWKLPVSWHSIPVIFLPLK